MWVSSDRTVVAGRIGGARGDVVGARLCGAVLALIMLPACADDASGGTDMAADKLTPTDNPVEGLSISAECQGIDFTDRIYSPGGTTLPNICEPFHATTNNPHAVRCTDAWPWYDTGFPGDEFCILPPEPEMGYQIGMHPQGAGDAWFDVVSMGDMSGYESPSDDWVMEGGEEEVRNYIGGSDNAEGFNYYRVNTRMRAGSHHMINSVAEAGATRGVWSSGDTAVGLSSAGQNLPGAQRPDVNVPNTPEKPAEDAGFYRVFPADSALTFNVHHFNPTDAPILKEAWINLWREDGDASVLVRGMGIDSYVPGQFLAMAGISPGDTRDLHYSSAITESIRVVDLFGHRHAWTTNFTAWVDRDGELEIVYQSFDWLDEPTYRYASGDDNPAPAPDNLTDGGHSGILTLLPGEELHFNCHIEYTEEQQLISGAPNSPASQGNLNFSNQAFVSEMCLLFGETAGITIPGATANGGDVPDFATID